MACSTWIRSWIWLNDVGQDPFDVLSADVNQEEGQEDAYAGTGTTEQGGAETEPAIMESKVQFFLHSRSVSRLLYIRGQGNTARSVVLFLHMNLIPAPLSALSIQTSSLEAAF